MEQNETKTCQCHQASPTIGQKPIKAAKKTIRSVPSFLLSVLIAFFPKCPICWAAYMSMLGGVGLAQTPFQGWLFPVLLGFLALHLVMVLKKAPQKGYGPFWLSLGGALLILGGRSLFEASDWALFPGMLLILSGSLWNSFSINRLNTSFSY